MNDSRISGLYRLSVRERIDELQRQGWLADADAELLRQGRQVLAPAVADNIIENVLGVFGLPFAIAPNFLVNGRGYIVPMVVEEPSVVAATSNAARLAIGSGGFEATCNESLLAGQVHLTGVADIDAAMQAVASSRHELLAAANEVHPRLVQRGGGVVDIESRQAGELLIVHLLVDTCDAMGANIVNTLCESIAPRIAAITGGEVALRILSNLADRSLVTARVRYRLQDLGSGELRPEEVRDRIVMASDIAVADPYRAATHNKGIMNGIDALAIATGNDWRAIEAGAHAYASLGDGYAPLATWTSNADGDLVGELCLPLKVGIVGGTLGANPAATIALRMTGVGSAPELAELMAAVGLAQNFAAIRALAAEGIQQGHMRMQARSTTMVRGKVASPTERLARKDGAVTASAKLILFGEHAVVYGRKALALPVPDAVSASVSASDELSIAIRDWGVEETIKDNPSAIGSAVLLIIRELGLGDQKHAIELHSSVPLGMGLGSSAAFAVAIVRAYDKSLGLGLDDARINAIAFACEKLAHGTPSGVDNTIATYGKPMLFSNAAELQVEELDLTATVPLVVAFSGHRGSTAKQVAGVRQRCERHPDHYNALFDQMDALSVAGAAALQRGDYAELGALMNIAHGLLAAIEVSTPELDAMCGIARAAGAAGAKLTGAGGGGSIVAVCPGKEADVSDALKLAGFDVLPLVD